MYFTGLEFPPRAIYSRAIAAASSASYVVKFRRPYGGKDDSKIHVFQFVADIML